MKNHFQKSSVVVKSLLVICVCSLASGCMLNRNNIADDFSADAGATSSGEYLVRMESGFGDAKVHRGTISGPMTVQDVLVESKAIKKYRDMEINILREMPGSPRPIKLAVDFEPARRAVVIGQDYAIHPGDRISVRAKDDGIIGRVMNMAFTK